MKQAILSYKLLNDEMLFNIGDYIQSIAARQFMPDKDLEFINREHLNEYSGEKCRLIMNGWFMHNPQNWPPADNIEPLFVSFHINNAVRKELSKSESIKYFKAHQPIGCRDQSTVDFLHIHGVDSYLSRCLTLTLGETYKHEQQSSEIIICDPLVDHYVSEKPRLKDIIPYGVTFVCRLRTLKKIRAKLFENSHKSWLKTWVNTIRYYCIFRSVLSKEVMINATYVTHSLKCADYPDEKSRFEQAEQLLKQYSRARYVITSRIHCALPCLAMGTPVVYVVNRDESDISLCRFDGITELFKVIEISSVNSCIRKSDFVDQLNYDSHFTNIDTYQSFADMMKEVCTKFCD